MEVIYILLINLAIDRKLWSSFSGDILEKTYLEDGDDGEKEY